MALCCAYRTKFIKILPNIIYLIWKAGFSDFVRFVCGLHSNLIANSRFPDMEVIVFGINCAKA